MNLSSEPALGGSVNEVLQQVVRQLDVLTKVSKKYRSILEPLCVCVCV